MRVYCDTGVFVDYLSARSHVANSLRTAPRGSRNPAHLASDAESVFQQCLKNHALGTSALTYYEVEESVFKELSRTMKGVAQAQALLVPVARSAALQFEMATQLFKVQLLDLTQAKAQFAVSNHALNVNGIRAADALHIATAVEFDADVVISGDSLLTGLNGKVANRSGKPMVICDTDVALTIL